MKTSLPTVSTLITHSSVGASFPGDCGPKTQLMTSDIPCEATHALTFQSATHLMSRGILYIRCGKVLVCSNSNRRSQCTQHMGEEKDLRDTSYTVRLLSLV